MNNRLAEARKAYGMSVTELAKRSQLSRQSIHLIEDGHVDPKASTILKISSALNADPREIFFTTTVKHDKQKEVSK